MNNASIRCALCALAGMATGVAIATPDLRANYVHLVLAFVVSLLVPTTGWRITPKENR